MGDQCRRHEAANPSRPTPAALGLPAWGMDSIQPHFHQLIKYRVVVVGVLVCKCAFIQCNKYQAHEHTGIQRTHSFTEQL